MTKDRFLAALEHTAEIVKAWPDGIFIGMARITVPFEGEFLSINIEKETKHDTDGQADS